MAAAKRAQDGCREIEVYSARARMREKRSSKSAA